jgi:hypothetical protein
MKATGNFLALTALSLLILSSANASQMNSNTAGYNIISTNYEVSLLGGPTNCIGNKPECWLEK